jgi:RHS repeat-associated protein
VTDVYEEASRLTSITQGSNVVQLAYDAASRRTSLTLPNGVSTQYGYDATSQVTALTYKLGAATLGDLAYVYDAAGNRIEVNGSWARTGVPQAVMAASYNANNQQLTFGSQALTYDLNGNLTSDGTNTYTWDARNRLTAIMGSVPASFIYDALGRRNRKTINGGATDFVYDILNPVQEQSGSTVTSLLPGLAADEYFSRVDATSTAFFLADALGSTAAIADDSGGVATAYTYEPFGATSTTGAATSNQYDFTSREGDPTGLKYYRARYYHPSLQRFVSEDPLGFYAGDTNLYAYVGNGPTNFVDPLGLVLTQVRVPTRNGWGTVCVDTGIAPDLQRAVAEALKNGIPLVFTDAFRTTQRQTDMYFDWLANPSKYRQVGAPGTSYHEAGLAFDVSVSLLASHYNTWKLVAAVHGFYPDVAGDRPHFQIRAIQEYGYSNLTEAINHNQQMQCSPSKSAR